MSGIEFPYVHILHGKLILKLKITVVQLTRGKNITAFF